MHDAVCGKNCQAVRLHANEGHHGVVGARVIAVLASPEAAEGQRRLIAVVAVGNDELRRPHRLDHPFNLVWFRHLPRGVDRPVLVRGFLPGVLSAFEGSLDRALRVAVEDKDLAEMRVRRLEQLEPVGLGR